VCSIVRSDVARSRGFPEHTRTGFALIRAWSESGFAGSGGSKSCQQPVACARRSGVIKRRR
jgi:hypothetical protein